MFLEDIQLSMQRISEYIAGYDFIKFKQDYKTVDSVVSNFEIIGEASKKIPKLVKEKYPQIPWEEMYYLRNKVSHEYHGIDYAIIWDVATNYLPENKSQIDKIIDLENQADFLTVATFTHTTPVRVLLESVKVLEEGEIKQEVENDLLSALAPLSFESCNRLIQIA